MSRIPYILSQYFVPLSILFYLPGFIRHLIETIFHKTSVLDWAVTQYYINYIDFGLVKRGLFGTILYPLFSIIPDIGMPRRLLIIAIDLLIFMILVYLLNTLIKKHLSNQSGISLFIRAVLIFSPVGFSQMSFDVGRYDHLNYILLIFAIYAVLAKRTLIGGLILTIGVLNHEAIFFFGVPVAFAAAYATLHSFRKALNTLIPPAFTIGYMLFFGNIDSDLLMLLPSSATGGIKVWSRGVFELHHNISLISYLALMFYSLTPYGFLYILYKENKFKLDLLFWSTLSPLALFALGADYFRWTQLILVAVLAAAFIVCKRGNLKIIELKYFGKAVALLYVLPLGPIGITTGLPYSGILK